MVRVLAQAGFHHPKSIPLRYLGSMGVAAEWLSEAAGPPVQEGGSVVQSASPFPHGGPPLRFVRAVPGDRVTLLLT